jgi:hypothetical protein
LRTVCARWDARQAFAAAFQPSKRLRQKAHLRRSFNLLAKGWRPSRKILLSFFRKLMFYHAIPPHMRGVRVVTNVEAGCDGHSRLRATSASGVDGEIVWS